MQCTRSDYLVSIFHFILSFSVYPKVFAGWLLRILGARSARTIFSTDAKGWYDHATLSPVIYLECKQTTMEFTMGIPARFQKA